MSSINVDDRLSSLPEEIQLHILNLMPTKYAVRTSVLSKRWRYSWMFVTNLDFDDTHPNYDLDILSQFMDRVLDSCKTTQLNLFRLNFSKRCYGESNVFGWIDKAVGLNVREIAIDVFLLELPLSMFTCKTLTKLRLDCGIDDYRVWKCPCPVNLPCLKSLDMVVFLFPFINAFKLISGCPVLESLSLEVTQHIVAQDFIFNIPTLKRLKLTVVHCCLPVTNKVVLNVPNLEYLYVGGVLGLLFVMEDVSSLVEASVLCHEVFLELQNHNLWFELLKGVSGVRSLSVRKALLEIPSTARLPSFPNLKNLDLKGYWRSPLILQFLEASPELNHLSIGQLSASACWIEPKVVAACMLTNLTTIEFSNCKWAYCDTPFLEYVLRNAEVLKTLTINWEESRVVDEYLLLVGLLKLPRASRHCEIHFHMN